jgi:hypothetical protein
VSCLNLINEALSRIRRTADATFYGLDHNGHCFVAVETQQNIARLWRNVIGNQEIVPPGDRATAPEPTTPGLQPPFVSDEDRPMPKSTSGRGLEIGA